MGTEIQLRVHGFDDQKLKKFTALKLFFIFWIKNCNLIILRSKTFVYIVFFPWLQRCEADGGRLCGGERHQQDPSRTLHPLTGLLTDYLDS